MPLSYRRILSYINSTTGPFTLHAISKELSHPVRGKRRRKKRAGGTKRDAGAIERIIRLLLATGYIEKRRKSYMINQDACSGSIRVNTSGNGILQLPDSASVIIPREMIRNARSGDTVLVALTDFKNGFWQGRVERVIARLKKRYMAQAVKKRGDEILFRLIDLPGTVEISCPRENAVKAGSEPEIGDFAILKLDEGGGRAPGCTVDEFFPSDSEESDLKRIIIKHSLPVQYRGRQFIQAPAGEAALRGREDCRKLFTVTIDGENAKDFDDAISLEQIDDTFRLTVHIADVSHFVKKGSPLDREALKRGTSFYLGDSVIPMLPEILSNDLCSLREGEDRLAMSVRMIFDGDGELTRTEFHRCVINVNRRLTYTTAHKLISEAEESELSRILKAMHRLAMLLKKRRMSRGRIDLNLPEEEIIFDGGRCVDIRVAARLSSHMLIEEFMLSANEEVSRALRMKKIPALYRIHENIDDEKFRALKKFLNTLGFALDSSRNRGLSLQKVIDGVSGKKYDQVINMVILKSMMQAYYGEKPLGHFGLGFRDYTHFTSPIRRYPDLIVHRCLKSLMDGSAPPYREEQLAEIGERSSEMERTAMKAERDMVKLKSCRLMQKNIGRVFDLIINGVSRFGLFVSLIDRPIEGMVPLSSLTDDYYLVQENEFTVIGKRHGRRFTIGDRTRGRLVKSSIEEMMIDFEIV